MDDENEIQSGDEPQVDTQDTQQQDEPQTPEPSVEERAIAAFDGIEDDNPAGDEGEADGEGADPKAPDGDGEGGEGGEGDEPQSDEDKAAAAEKAAKEELDKEVTTLQLKGRAETRFRELSGRVAELTQQLEKYGGADGLERLARDANDQREWDQRMNQLGLTPEEFGQAVGFAAAAKSNDPAVLQQLHENLTKVVGEVSKRLGMKTPDFDPLDQHPDLKDKVLTGQLDEADALEIARLRGLQGLTEEQRQTAQQQTQQQTEQQQGIQSLQQLGTELKTRDGEALFNAKFGVIRGALDAALVHLPPSQWQQHARSLYDAVQVQAPAQQRPRAGKQPIRQSHANKAGHGVAPQTPADPMAAWDLGVEEARARGL